MKHKLPTHKNTSLLQATRVSIRGLFLLLAHERAARRELILIVFSLVLVVISGGAILPIAMLIIALSMLAIECMNTAIERLCDMIHPAPSDSIKNIKDIAAAPLLILSTLYGMTFGCFIYTIITS